MTGRSPPPGFSPDQVEPPALGDGPWPISSLALDLSGRCNLACRYCAEAATQPARPAMSKAMLDCALQLLCSGEAAPRRSIRLGSGEPLLALPLLHQLADLLAKQAELRPQVYITTNGTLATQEVRDWLVDVGWDIKVSLDGPGRVHDKWRVRSDGGGTFDAVAEVVTDLANRLPPQRFSVTAVLCGGTDPEEAFEGIAALGVRRIELVPAAHESSSVRPSPDDVARYEAFVMAYARRYLEMQDWTGIPILAQFTGKIYRLMGYNLRRTACGAGRTFIAADATGRLYPCFRFIGIERYQIGQLPGGLDRQAATAFHRGAGRPYERREACSACWAAPLCAGPCFACAEMFGPGDGRPVALHCEYELADARAAVWLVQQLRQHQPDRLLSFLPGGVTEGLL